MKLEINFKWKSSQLLLWINFIIFIVLFYTNSEIMRCFLLYILYLVDRSVIVEAWLIL